uniref:Uncharacterized protein n=1 Tax=Romanomermis culicivorax TaxID=13658 RepID=A0A915JKS7_ROMCU
MDAEIDRFENEKAGGFLQLLTMFEINRLGRNKAKIDVQKQWYTVDIDAKFQDERLARHKLSDEQSPRTVALLAKKRIEHDLWKVSAMQEDDKDAGEESPISVKDLEHW